MIAIKIDNIILNVSKLSFSISESSKILGCDKSVIKSAILSGELPFLIPDGRIQKKISIFDLINYIKNRSVTFEKKSIKRAS